MRIVLYTNILTPYRKHFYDLFYQECKTNGDEFYALIMADGENNRVWKYSDYKTDYTQLLEGQTISHGETYIHINKNLNHIVRELEPDILIISGSYLCPGTWTLSRKNSYKCRKFFWSESHLGEARSYTGLKIAIREQIRKTFYKRFDGFLYPGQLAKAFILKYAKPDSKLVFLPNLVDERLYQDKKECHGAKSENEIVFFTPARLSEVKGIGPFFDLVAKCKNKNKAKFIIAGDGDLRNELERKAKELEIHAVFLGNRSATEVADLYQQTDVFLLPSLSDPNPLTCVEALWSGKPLLISDHVGNHPEVVKQGINGYVFSYNDAQNAVRIIEDMIDSKTQWIMQAQETSRSIAEEIYSSARVTKRVLNELKEDVAR